MNIRLKRVPDDIYATFGKTLVATAGFIGLAKYNYLLFHSLIEGFTIVIATFETTGLTSFKIISEYVIISIIVAGLLYWYVKKKYSDSLVFKTVVFAMFFTILSEVCFTLYSDVTGLSNLIGHLLKAVSYYVLFQGLISVGLDMPYTSIFNDLLMKSSTDDLTNAFNRRYLIERINDEIMRSQRYGNPFSVIMLDIDNFKRINDQLGHHCGDQVLQSLVQIIKNRIRQLDILARWGGEEFMLLLPSTRLNSAVCLAEDLKRLCGDIHLDGLERVTASFGVTEYIPGDTDERIFNRADKLMYSAKAKGKNRVVSDRDHTPRAGHRGLIGA